MLAHGALHQLDFRDRRLSGAGVGVGLEGNILALTQVADACAFQRGGMNEHVLAAVRRLNETETLLSVVELDLAVNHFAVFLWLHCDQMLARDHLRTGSFRRDMRLLPGSSNLVRVSETCVNQDASSAQ